MVMQGTVTLTPQVSDNDHVFGPETAPATLLEFGDYECPYCGTAQEVIEEVRQALGNTFRFAFRNFPLTQIHPYALGAALAAESAGGQGKFWEMHRTLYAHQEALTDTDLMKYAQQIGLDMNQFRHDMERQTYLDKIESDVRSGMESGVPGTPTLFLNGVRYEGPVNAEALVRAIQRS